MELAKAKSKKKSKRNEEQHELPSLERILVEDVQVISKHHREVDGRKVASLAASMAKIRLRTPITVRRIEKDLDTKIFLSAGLYRLEAAKKLGWEYIDAFVMEGTKADARMWQLMENLYRADLTALQRAEHVTELVQGVLQGAEGVQVAPPGGQQPHDRGIKKAAKALGFTRDEVRRSLKIDGICEAAKTKAKELGLDDNQSALLKIAEEDGKEAQLGLVEDIKSGKTSGSNIAAPGKRDPKKKKSLKPPTEDTSDTDEQQEVASPSLAPESNEDTDPDSQELEEPDNLDDTEKDRLFSELKAAWDNAPKSVRKRFVKKVLCLDPNDMSEEVWTS
jgi:ParB-like chromosome segregation protein Spo0J